MNFHLRPFVDVVTAGSCARICFSACPSRRSHSLGEKSPILCLMGMFTRRCCYWIQARFIASARVENAVCFKDHVTPSLSSISLIGC